ncbi:hypothetical protein EPO33_00280 [Patescibacteria group bacterium]|nr:MAG: hypothetical protein EPO33_00280 [Patescibacteria group bacterium]
MAGGGGAAGGLAGGVGFGGGGGGGGAAGGNGCGRGGWETAGGALMASGFGPGPGVAIGAGLVGGLAISGFGLARNKRPKNPGCLTGVAADGGGAAGAFPGTYRANPGLSLVRFLRSSSSFFLNSSGRSEMPSAIGATVKNHESSIARPIQYHASPGPQQR